MSSLNILNKEISMDNIKSALELFFRQNSIIDDNQVVERITFATIKNPTTIIEWESRKTVPIQIVLKEDLCDIIIHR